MNSDAYMGNIKVNETGLEHKLFYYINGQIHEEYFIDIYGNKQGKYIEYHDTGKVLSQSFYVNDLLHGKKMTLKFNVSKSESTYTKEYYQNGKKVFDKDTLKKLTIIDRFKKK